MLFHCAKILVAVILSLMFTISLGKVFICIWSDVYIDAEVEEWLEQNNFGKFKQLFKDRGKICISLGLLSWNELNFFFVFFMNE